MRSYLIVDDNRPLADNLAEILRDCGDRAAVAAGGPEALDLVTRERFDVVLTDMRMPSMDGATLMREIRRTDPGLPAIVVTAFSRDAGIQAAQNEGPLAVLPKPVPMPQLLHLLRVARRNGRVLLLEDDPVLADNLTAALQERGFSVTVSASVEAVGRFAADRPLLAIVDLELPAGPGGHAIDELANRLPGLPILAMTTSPEASAFAGVEHVFAKPFDAEQLLSRVEDFYRRAGADS
jgi:CheY-like chemotaxis protein